MRSGVVLVGGLSTRFEAGDKSMAPLEGVPMVQRVVDAVSPAVDEVVLVARDEEQVEELGFLDLPVATDSVSGFGPVAGLHAGFSAADGDLCFLTACDTPLVRSGVVEYLFEACDGFDGAVPSNGYLEPLTAAYRRDPMRDAAELAMERGDHRIIELYGDMGPINAVPKEELRSVDPDLVSFLNVNTVEDLEEAERAMERIRDG